MFDDFHSSSKNQQQARKRFGGSMAAAIVVYGTSSAAIVGATAATRQVTEEKETQIEFAPPPEPEPPPPVEAAPPPKPSPRPKVKRATLKPPDEIPLEKPKESNDELAEAGEAGPQDGFLDGVEGGTGNGAAPPPPPPPPKVEKLIPPIGLSSNDEKPKYTASAKRKGIEGVVVVSFEVLESGKVTSPRIVSGPPELHETVLKFVMNWRFKPAHRGGKPVRYRMTKQFRFVLEDA